MTNAVRHSAGSHSGEARKRRGRAAAIDVEDIVFLDSVGLPDLNRAAMILASLKANLSNDHSTSARDDQRKPNQLGPYTRLESLNIPALV